jgi:hypothetical protein
MSERLRGESEWEELVSLGEEGRRVRRARYLSSTRKRRPAKVVMDVRMSHNTGIKADWKKTLTPAGLSLRRSANAVHIWRQEEKQEGERAAEKREGERPLLEEGVKKEGLEVPRFESPTEEGTTALGVTAAAKPIKLEEKKIATGANSLNILSTYINSCFISIDSTEQMQRKRNDAFSTTITGSNPTGRPSLTILLLI